LSRTEPGRLARHAVAEVDDSRAEGAGLDELEIHPALALGKERNATADKHRVDPGPVLVDQAERERIRALFLDSITDPRTMERIAHETGVAIGGTLYGDALSRAGGEADTYVKMIRHDVSTIKAGLLKN